MVWEGIIMNGRSELRTCQGNGLYNRDNVIEPFVVPYTRQLGKVLIFQDDNATSDRVHVVRDHLQFCRVTTFPNGQRPLPSPTPQWGAADTEMKVPSDDNTELRGSPLKSLE